MLAARDALKYRTKVVGVVSANAKSYADSFTRRIPVESTVNTIIADGLASRVPEKSALELIWKGVDRIVKVSDEEIAEAIRVSHECTHNICEGSVSEAFEAAMQESSRNRVCKVAVIASGGNIDRKVQLF